MPGKSAAMPTFSKAPFTQIKKTRVASSGKSLSPEKEKSLSPGQLYIVQREVDAPILTSDAQPYRAQK